LKYEGNHALCSAAIHSPATLEYPEGGQRGEEKKERKKQKNETQKEKTEAILRFRFYHLMLFLETMTTSFNTNIQQHQEYW
jgi:hypothetical protein